MQLQVKPQKAAKIMYLEKKKQQTRYHLTYFKGFEVTRKARFFFSRPKSSMKVKRCVFGGYKQRNKVCLVNLRWKLQENRYG